MKTMFVVYFKGHNKLFSFLTGINVLQFKLFGFFSGINLNKIKFIFCLINF